MANGDQQGCAHDLLLLAGDKRAAGAPEEQCSTTKRGRGRDLFAWHARLPQCVAFKTFVENISNVLSEGHFTVVRTKDFQGIETDSMDPARVALVQGRLTAAVEGDVNDGNHSFCIKMSNVLCCLRNAHAQHFLDLSRPLGSTDVVLHVYEPEVNTYTPTFKLRTLAKEADSIRLRVMDYKILVEIDLQTFRNAIKTAKDHKADSVDFRVFTPKKRSGKRVTTFFVIKYASDEVSSVFPYQSVTEEESIGCDEGDSSKTRGTVCIKASENIAGDYDALPCEDELDTLYCAKFAVDYLFLFVKARPARVFPRRCRSARGASPPRACSPQCAAPVVCARRAPPRACPPRCAALVVCARCAPPRACPPRCAAPVVCARCVPTRACSPRCTSRMRRLCGASRVQGMDRSGVSLHLSPSQPLVLDYPLGCSKTDFIRFVLAPKVTDD